MSGSQLYCGCYFVWSLEFHTFLWIKVVCSVCVPTSFFVLMSLSFVKFKTSWIVQLTCLVVWAPRHVKVKNRQNLWFFESGSVWIFNVQKLHIVKVILPNIHLDMTRFLDFLPRRESVICTLIMEFSPMWHRRLPNDVYCLVRDELWSLGLDAWETPFLQKFNEYFCFCEVRKGGLG